MTGFNFLIPDLFVENKIMKNKKVSLLRTALFTFLFLVTLLGSITKTSAQVTSTATYKVEIQKFTVGSLFPKALITFSEKIADREEYFRSTTASFAIKSKDASPLMAKLQQQAVETPSQGILNKFSFYIKDDVMEIHFILRNEFTDCEFIEKIEKIIETIKEEKFKNKVLKRTSLTFTQK